MSRKKAREIVLCLVFLKDCHGDVGCEKLYSELFENFSVEELCDSFGEKAEKNANRSTCNEHEQSSCADLCKPAHERHMNEVHIGSCHANRSTLRKADEDYIKSTFFGVFENIGRIDGIVSECVVGWQYGRISKISMAILRTAAYEILYAEDVPALVAINEAVELSKRYDDPEAYLFVNGVLGAVMKCKDKDAKDG